jgi:hypothetical protein
MLGTAGERICWRCRIAHMLGGCRIAHMLGAAGERICWGLQESAYVGAAGLRIAKALRDSALKVHKNENFLAPILNFVHFIVNYA